MGWFSSILNLSPKEPTTVIKNWRVGMWVVNSTSQVGILYQLGDMCTLHLVDTYTGETVQEIYCPLSELRQAKYDEIPQVRRNITKTQAEALGYGS